MGVFLTSQRYEDIYCLVQCLAQSELWINIKLSVVTLAFLLLLNKGMGPGFSEGPFQF